MAITDDEKRLLANKLYLAGEPDFNLLRNLQAHIVKHHGRDYAWHIFLEFNQKEAEAVKICLHIYAQGLTSAFQQLADVVKHHEDGQYDGGIVKCLYLSKTGYDKIGLQDVWNNNKKYDDFKQGMSQRAGLLKDPGQSTWEKDFPVNPDGMILIADDHIERLQEELDRIKKLCTGAVAVKYLQKGEILWGEDGKTGIEHFGYADGISQPEFLAAYQPPGRANTDAADKSILLVTDPGRSYDPSCWGSFLVFRKLEQNVRAFKEREEELGSILFPNLSTAEEEKAEIAGAYVVGRFEDGTPVVKHDEAAGAGNDNDFDYTHDMTGSRCPYHAHVRMVNPRASIAPLQTAFPGYEPPKRITRRGIPYDEVKRNNDLSWFPSGGVGLLFMSFQSNIADSFEKMQQMANMADGIIGNGIEEHYQQWPVRWDKEKLRLYGFSFADFVKLRGGEYFFAPSIPFLQNL